jgi:hypothetical protein
MSNKIIKRKAEELLGYGMPKQQVFDSLMVEHPEAKLKKVAEILRYMPTLQARERYRNLHIALMVVIVVSAVLRVLRPVLENAIRMDQATAYVSLVPIATILVGWTIYRWQGQVLMWVGWANIASLGTFVKNSAVFARGDADAWYIAFTALPVLIGALSLLLVWLAFPGYKVEKDSLGGPERVVFQEERTI